ncbi:hypothetical protein BN1110_04485 [bacterium YEK0313]|nr:hypothetical protein BN1110_04485 [bacterium YEK0313]
MKRLVVILCALYLATVVGAAMLTGHGLIEPVPRYRLAILWMAPETLAVRLDALAAAGRDFEARVYGFAHDLSWLLVAVLVLVGLGRPFFGPSRPLAPVRSSAIVLGGLAGLVLLNHWARPILDLAGQVPSASTTFSAMPAYWLLGMALSAAVTGGHLALVAHDVVLWCRGGSHKAGLA